MGNGIQATAAVVALTIAGLALGSRWAGRRADACRRPLLAYALLEAGIASWAFGTPALFRLLPRVVLLLPRLGGASPADSGPGSLLATALLLLPGTFLMGATTPFLVRHGSTRWRPPGPPHREAPSGGEILGPLYAWNTLGGAVGALGTVFLLLPRLGLARTTLAAGSLDLLVALAVLPLVRHAPVAGSSHGGAITAASTSSRSHRPPRRIRVLGMLGMAGVLGGISQMAWTRLLVLFFGSSTQALGITLASVLLGLSAGSAWAGRRLEKGGDPEKLARQALFALAAVIGVSLLVWGRMPALIVLGLGLLGGGFAAALALQGAVSLLLLFPAAACLGGLLPVLTSLLRGGGLRSGEDSGDGFSLDSWGTAAGALAASFLVLPGLGMEETLRLAGIGALLLLLPLPGAAGWRRRLPAGAGLILLILLPRWDPVLMTSGPMLYAGSYGAGDGGIAGVEAAMRRRGPLRFLEEGPDSTVTVREGAGGILSLQINGKTDASTGPDLPTQLLAGRLPALLRPEAGSVLVIGLATGTTAGVLLSRAVRRLDCVEISPAVIRAAPLFSAVNGGILEKPRLHLWPGDGRTYLQRTSRRYDVITSQPTNPWIAGVTNLFTVEFFRLARERLAQGGILTVWLQGYSLDPGDFRSAVATFLRVFPKAQLWEESAGGGDYFLVGWKRDDPPDLAAVERELDRRKIRKGGRPPEPGEDAAGLLAHFVAGPRGLSRLSRGAPLVRDDNLRLEFSAPRALWDYRMPELTAALEEVRESPLAYFPVSSAPDADALRARLRELESRRADRIRLALSLRRADYEAFSAPELMAAADLVRRGLPDAALPFLREAERHAPGAPALPLLEGWILLGQGEAAEAAGSFRKARKLDPLSSEAANGEGLAAWREGRLEQAESSFRAATELSPADPEPPNNLASVLLAEGRNAQALPWLDQVLSRHPRFVPARINRGVALARLGRLEEATAEYREALRLDPDNSDAAYNLERAGERIREKTSEGAESPRPGPGDSPGRH